MEIKKEDIELLRMSIAKWGKNLQMIMVVEECAELQHAISKAIRAGNYNRLNKEVCEELADVEIMIDQMKLIFSEELIKKYRAEKLLRLKSRLENK